MIRKIENILEEYNIYYTTKKGNIYVYYKHSLRKIHNFNHNSISLDNSVISFYNKSNKRYYHNLFYNFLKHTKTKKEVREMRLG